MANTLGWETDNAFVGRIAMTKYILYVLTSRTGAIKSFKVLCGQNDSDEANMGGYAPDKLRGNAGQRLRSLLSRGFSLSNWHVIEQ